MQVKLSEKADRDLIFWKKSGNKMVLNKIGLLINAIKENPYKGIGKPEQLKHQLSGIWSRRINLEHRLVYKITKDNTLEILNIISLKGHYN